ncbi:MAG: hypothetical protein KME32_26520 [Mojavia pulchra JT2-VF2]|jgi:hypothetical protein|uniref:Uncharacterized protein n=1 Tax=Mojavia pulchra JT2-VF2 TaxID=287848 RepID=A0A951UID8_9NOST|nr:hypothetical protein [Mojavia pulchra JT2-VF2]
MPQRILKDVIQFLGLMCLLAAGTFGFYMAMVAYQLCSLESQCPILSAIASERGASHLD